MTATTVRSQKTDTAQASCRTRGLKRLTREILNTELAFRSRPTSDEPVEEQSVIDRLATIREACRNAGRISAAASLLPVSRYLLTADEERLLFRDMNVLKSRANALRSRLDPDNPSRPDVEAVSRLLDLVGRIRDVLVECNSRLVIANARHVANSESQFEEFVSEGFTVLMRAVDLFDYARGFRFSTYLTHSVRRHFYRLVQKHSRQRKQQPATGNEILSSVADRETTPLAEIDFAKVCGRIMRKGENRLDNREQAILASRFGLTGGKPQTLRQIADGLGISKERVRQLQLRALEKLRDVADALNITIG